MNISMLNSIFVKHVQNSVGNAQDHFSPIALVAPKDILWIIYFHPVNVFYNARIIN